MKIKLVQTILDKLRFKKLRYELKIKKTANYISKLNQETIEKLKLKVKKGEKIKVAFLHMYATSIQNVSIFEKMLNSDIFDPYFIVNPDISRSKENFDFNYKRTKEELIEKYGKERVLDGYSYEKDEYFDYTNDFDLMTTNNPYTHMAQEYFQIKYWALKGIPIFYISYFYMGRCDITKLNLQEPEFSYLWKAFVENNYVKKLSKKYEAIKGKNIVVTGYPKMDKLDKLKPSKKDKKLIIIAPHHSINMDFLSGFLEYADYLPKLVEKYKNIDFIFRPHPLLMQNLYKDEFWGKEKTEKWMENLLANKNIKYFLEGDYLQLFVDSDGLMHDCGSYSSEYLYLNKPCAFFIKKDLKMNKTFTSYGRKTINTHYLLRNFDDCCKFIDNVVLKGDNIKKKSREKFVKKEVAINYPNATDKILEYIEKSFKEQR